MRVEEVKEGKEGEEGKEAKEVPEVPEKKRHHRPIHQYDRFGNEILVCPYKGCSQTYPGTCSGKANMSRHMKKHKDNGTPLAGDDGLPRAVKLYEKYNYTHDDESETTSRPSAPVLPEVMKTDVIFDLDNPTSVADWAAHSEEALATLGSRLSEWTQMDDGELTAKVPYPVLARSLIQYSKNVHINAQCNFRLLGERVDNLNDRITVMKKIVDDFPKQVEEMRDDVKKAASGVFDKSCQLEGLKSDVEFIKATKNINDIRATLEKEMSRLASSALNHGLEDHLKLVQVALATKARQDSFKAVRTAMIFGLPKEGGLDKALAILSEEEQKKNTEEEKELTGMAPHVPDKRRRQFDASQALIEAEKSLPPKPIPKPINLDMDAATINELLEVSMKNAEAGQRPNSLDKLLTID